MPKRRGGGEEIPNPHAEKKAPEFTSIEDLNKHTPELERRLRQFALSLTRNEDAAGDLVQITFEKALTFKDSFKGGNLLSWMFRIMRNARVDQMRSAESSIVDWISGPLDVSDSPDVRSATAPDQVPLNEIIESRERWNLFTRAFAELDERQQQVVFLRADGMEYSEIAEQLHIPIGTVMSSLSRAREKLRELMRTYGAE